MVWCRIALFKFLTFFNGFLVPESGSLLQKTNLYPCICNSASSNNSRCQSSILNATVPSSPRWPVTVVSRVSVSGSRVSGSGVTGTAGRSPATPGPGSGTRRSGGSPRWAAGLHRTCTFTRFPFNTLLVYPTLTLFRNT